MSRLPGRLPDYAPRNMCLILCDSTFAPADSTVYYMGAPIAPPSTTAAQRRVYAGVYGRIKSASFAQTSDIVPTGENMVFAIRINNTTDYTYLTIASAAVVSNQTMNLDIPLKPTDYIELKMTTPAWVTNPTTVRIMVHLTILLD